MKCVTIAANNLTPVHASQSGPAGHEPVHVAVLECDLQAGIGYGWVIPSLWQAHEVSQHTLAAEPLLEFRTADLLPVVPQPRTIICVGLNYREHIAEMGHPIPDHPTLFAKFSQSLTGPFQDVHIPASMNERVDYEGELAVIIGPGGTIAGYSLMNDLSQRDWQYRTQQWLQGKNLRASSGFGPFFVPAEQWDPVREGVALQTWVNGELRQDHSVADLVFTPQELVAYISTFTDLEAGDVIVTGTPEGVGHGMQPPKYLRDGDTVRVGMEGLGYLENTFRIATAE